MRRGSSNRLDDRRRAWARVLAITACACAALAGPGRAHAATPSPGGLYAQVQSALDQVNQVAPEAVAAVQPAVDQALAASSAAAPAMPPAATPDASGRYAAGIHPASARIGPVRARELSTCLAGCRDFAGDGRR